MSRNSEDGYALTEVLVAGAIAAATIAASLQGMAMALNSGRRAADAQARIIDAQNIEARLRAGTDLAGILEDYPGWRLDIAPADRPVEPRTASVLTRAAITAPGDAVPLLQIVYMEAGPGQPDGGGQP